MSVLRFKGIGLAGWCVYTGKGNQDTLVSETTHVANFRHQLRPEDRTNAEHPHHDRVLRKLRSQYEHFVLDCRIVSMIVLS